MMHWMIYHFLWNEHAKTRKMELTLASHHTFDSSKEPIQPSKDNVGMYTFSSEPFELISMKLYDSLPFLSINICDQLKHVQIGYITTLKH